MGAKAGITMYAPDEVIATRAATSAFERMDELENVLSDYRADSEVMEVCKAAEAATADRPALMIVSETLFDAVNQSLEWSKRTGGAFDITVGPFSALWREARKTGVPPDPNAIAIARRSVGFRKLRTQEIPDMSQKHVESVADLRTLRILSFRAPNIRLDFGGIGKGMAADEALAILNEHGISSALIDLGGDFAIGAPPPGRDGWSIEVRTHDQTRGDETLVLANCAIATSGDLEQFIEYEGRRYSHIIDPRTGYGLTNRAAATVIAPNATTADALASAACVLGGNDAIELIESIDGAEARVVQIDPAGLRVIASTSGFPDAVTRGQ